MGTETRKRRRNTLCIISLLSSPEGPPVKLCCDSPFPRKTWPAGAFHFSLELRAVATVVASEVGLLIPTDGGG